jgi:hypothetical protein
MARQLAHPDRVAAAAPEATSSSRTGDQDRTGEPARGDAAVVDIAMFGDVDPRLRMRMELVARASASAQTALPHVVALLVEGAEARDAVTAAIVGNEPLHEQWLRTWEALRR